MYVLFYTFTYETDCFYKTFSSSFYKKSRSNSTSQRSETSPLSRRKKTSHQYDEMFPSCCVTITTLHINMHIP